MSQPSPEYYILCEGYHDRAFWYGWFLVNGWKSGRYSKDSRLKDLEHKGGYSVFSPNNLLAIIVPCEGHTEILNTFRKEYKRLNNHIRTALEMGEMPTKYKFILNVDDDTPGKAKDEDDETETSPLSHTLHIESVRSKLRALDPDLREEDGWFYLLDGQCEVTIVRWQVKAEEASDIPQKQTLERMVCAAIRAVYAERAETVNQWLKSRPAPPKETPKEHTWSYMAGWYPEHGCEDFFKTIWRDKGNENGTIRQKLEEILQVAGYWGIFEELSKI